MKRRPRVIDRTLIYQGRVIRRCVLGPALAGTRQAVIHNNVSLLITKYLVDTSEAIS